MKYHFPLDHFGVIVSPMMQQLMDQSSNKRQRRVAFNSLARMLKTMKQVQADQIILTIGYEVDSAGQLTIAVETAYVIAR